MIRQRLDGSLRRFFDWRKDLVKRGAIPSVSLTIALACAIGILTGLGAALFNLLIHTIRDVTVQPVMTQALTNSSWYIALCACPALGLLCVAWLTRKFAPEAEGHGVPEVIVAVARNDGVIRPRVSLVKILASSICIGTGGSVGREGPIIQIGSSLGSVGGQLFKMSPRNVKVLVAAGAAAGISATFNAPLAGVIFSSEVILGSFAAESLTPIVIASVMANIVQRWVGEYGLNPAFPQIHYEFLGTWEEVPSYFLLGLLCGLGAVSFTKLLYATEDLVHRRLPTWWTRALVTGGLVGLAGVVYPLSPPVRSAAAEHEITLGHQRPPLFGVGYQVVDHTLHLQYGKGPDEADAAVGTSNDQTVYLTTDDLLREFWWVLPLIFLKPLLTSVTLAGGGSGGIFAPSLFLGATTGAAFGLICNVLVPEHSADPGVYAIVGMGAVVAGTTHAVISAILIVYEMTNDYRIILPIMIAAGLSSVVARLIDPESIYHKKLSRRGDSIARGHEMHRLEHIMVRDVMLRSFPRLKHTDDLNEIIRVARGNPKLESLPVMDDDGLLVGIIRPEDLHRLIDTDLPRQLVHAGDIALKTTISVKPNENLLEAMSDLGRLDVETLPVEVGKGNSRRLVGLLLRADVMRRYRQEMLAEY